MDFLGVLYATIIISLIIGGYFLPLIIAICCNHRNILGIGLLNLFAGWTLVGWVGALIWAVLAEPAPVRYERRIRRR